ncbi:Phospholipase SGR2 [Camellia lanceoleosa]|uniref:Phospholipase SGR2 n=1 Tax=Camellia lanceoleosa TaxID=1840588 RepID=A0ACC0FW03_9ERIC|nr:Phospholipase SGR2 [Camellia lanceoleosa]
MADMEIVLPEKKNPGLTPMDWVIFLGSAIVGLVAVVGSLDMPKADLWVIFAILSTVIGYCAKTYVTFQQNMATYQNLITQSMYDKQLDSGKGTLLHLCDDVIQQEVKVSEDTQEKEERSYGSIMMERLTGGEDGRIDHVLQDKTFQHPYISAIGSHTNYWRDYDTALFILKHCIET